MRTLPFFPQKRFPAASLDDRAKTAIFVHYFFFYGQ